MKYVLIGAVVFISIVALLVIYVNLPSKTDTRRHRHPDNVRRSRRDVIDIKEITETANIPRVG